MLFAERCSVQDLVRQARQAEENCIDGACGFARTGISSYSGVDECRGNRSERNR